MSKIQTLSGTPISPLCFGCMQFGANRDDDESDRIYQACRDAGVNFFDTAHVYTDGASETILGGLIKDHRDQVVVASKVAYTGGAGRGNILASFEESQKRLDVDLVDILYLHRWDDETPLEETFGALVELQEGGKVRHIGVSNYSAWQVMKAQGVAQRLGTRIEIIQPMYSLVKRQAEVELLPMAAAEGIAVASYSPLGGGLLTGKYGRGEAGRLSHDERYGARYGQEWMHGTAQALAAVTRERGVAAATLAVAWAAHHPAVTAPIISARTLEQLGPSLAALSFDLSEGEYGELSALSPKPAPATDRLEEAG